MCLCPRCINHCQTSNWALWPQLLFEPLLGISPLNLPVAVLPAVLVKHGAQLLSSFKIQLPLEFVFVDLWIHPNAATPKPNFNLYS